MNSLIYDFDRCAIGNLVIGENYSEGNGKEVLGNQELDYVVYIKDDCIDGVFICLNTGYRDYKKFNGCFRKNKKDFELSSSSKPDDIMALFGEPDRQWNDGSEVNIQFVEQEHRIEFSWRILNSGDELDYLIAELD